MANNNNKISVKVLIDTKSQKVMFAEAGKDFVDFLITLLALLIATVIRMLTKKSMVGTLGNLYHSIETLSDTYIRPNLDKTAVLNPKVQLVEGDGATSAILSLPSSAAPPSKPKCGYSDEYVYERVVVRGPVSPKKMAAEEGGGGYVKGVVTYMVMDNLVVKPMSTISSIAMLNQFNVKDIGALEERTVSLGMDEGMKLLEASLRSNTVLTDVLLQSEKTTKKRRSV